MARPKALVLAVALLAAFVVALTASPARSAAQRETQLPALNRQIALAINIYRRAHGLRALHVSAQLNAASRQHSEEMGAGGYFDHSSADGTVYWKRIQQYYPATNYSYWTVGENLLYSTPTVNAPDALKLWIGSPEHKRNLLDPNWTDLGVSAVHVAKAGGVYGGHPVTIVTTDFGARH